MNRSRRKAAKRHIHASSGKRIAGTRLDADPAASGCVRVGALKIADMLSRILELIWFSLAPAGVDAWDAKPKPLTTRLNMS